MAAAGISTGRTGSSNNMPVQEYRGFCGASYQGRSIAIASDRKINFYPELVESGTGKSQYCLIGTPGIRKLMDSQVDGSVRGICAQGGRVLIAGQKTLYELNQALTLTTLGEIAPDPTYSGLAPVTFAYNGVQYVISSGGKGYLLNGSVLSEITDIPIDQIEFLDGYFVALSLADGKVYVSTLYDGATWDALAYAVKESAPDRAHAIKADHGELWVWGALSAEVWYNSGNADYPFQRASGGRLELGCAAPWSPAKLDNSVFWVGNDERGNRVVWRADGYTAKRISTHAIEYRMNLISPRTAGVSVMASTTTFATGYAYQEEGHSFYCLLFPNAMNEMSQTIKDYAMPTMLVYDCATGLWHERAWWNPNLGRYEPPRQRCHAYVWDHHLVGDRDNGFIYEQHLDYYDDAGDRIRREVIGPNLSANGKTVFYNSFQLEMEVAVGLGVIDSLLYGPDAHGQMYQP
jgi:hypothetical protein